MPKKARRNKRGRPRMSVRAALKPPPAHSVKELLGSSRPTLKRVTDRVADQAARASFWSAWLAAHLAPPAHERICAIAERDGTLVIFAETAAWSARLRYAILELQREIHAADPAVTAIEVRVLPRR
jgi:hypothetical protein